jgi:hypothetical protein
VTDRAVDIRLTYTIETARLGSAGPSGIGIYETGSKEQALVPPVKGKRRIGRPPGLVLVDRTFTHIATGEEILVQTVDMRYYVSGRAVPGLREIRNANTIRALAPERSLLLIPKIWDFGG